jgi:hypothetical protein
MHRWLSVVWVAAACARVDVSGEPDTGNGAVDEVPSVGPLPALCQESGPPPPVPADLVAWAAQVDASNNLYFGSGRLAELNALGDALPRLDEAGAPVRLERAWLRHTAGDLEGSIADYAWVLAAPGGYSSEALVGEAVAWLRLAEVTNCASGGSTSCIVPLDAAAEHEDPTGAARAAELLRQSLTLDPIDTETRVWLLNVAAMAMGTWPESVEPAWRLEESFFRDGATLEPFRGVSMSYGLDEGLTPAGGAAVADVNGDGYLDMMLSTMTPGGDLALWLNAGDGRLCEATQAAGLQGIGGIGSFTTADFDGDGDEDIFAPRAAWLEREGVIRPSLLLNDGQGHFRDLAVERGLGEPGPAQVSAWADVDLDGDLDLFEGREGTGEDWVRPSSLYLQEEDGTFVDVAEAWGVRDLGVVKGASWGDLDGDGDPDLTVSRLGQPNVVFRNQGDRFEDVTAQVGGEGALISFATWFFDMDHDGDPDLFSASLVLPDVEIAPAYTVIGHGADAWVRSRLGRPLGSAETLHLYRNDDGVFTDVTVEVGLDQPLSVMGSSFGDLDADGWPDLLLGTGLPDFDAQVPNVAFVQRDGVFEEVTTSSRLGHLAKGHGVSFGDIDEDGDEDILTNLGGMFSGDGFQDGLYVNPHGRAGLAVDLVGTVANRAAIGARVRILSDLRIRYATVGEGGSFGNNSHRIEIPLAGDERIEAIEIDWPGSGSERVEGLETGRLHVVTEGSGVTSSRPLARFTLDVSGDHAHEESGDPVP